MKFPKNIELFDDIYEYCEENEDEREWLTMPAIERSSFLLS